MLSATRDRVEVTLARIRRFDRRYARSLDSLRRSRYRLRCIRGGAEAAELPDLSRRSVVVVEENADNREVFATFLRACGAHVVAAPSADVALRYLHATSVDVIMTDVSVLPLGGVQFIDAVRRLAGHKSTPILAVTGWTEKAVRPVECGFTSFVQKPVDLDRLALEILRLVADGIPAVGLRPAGGT